MGQARTGENKKGGTRAVKKASAWSLIPGLLQASPVMSASMYNGKKLAVEKSISQQHWMLFWEEKQYTEITMLLKIDKIAMSQQ